MRRTIGGWGCDTGGKPSTIVSSMTADDDGGDGNALRRVDAALPLLSAHLIAAGGAAFVVFVIALNFSHLLLPLGQSAATAVAFKLEGFTNFAGHSFLNHFMVDVVSIFTG